MKALRLAITDSERPVVMFMYDDESPFEIFHLKDVKESIYQLAATLATVIEGVRGGSAFPEMFVRFSHRSLPTCLALRVVRTPADSNARMEFREYQTARVDGGLDSKNESELVHEVTMSLRQLCDTLHSFLEELVQPRLLEIYKNDKPLLIEVLRAICLYDAERKNLPGEPTPAEPLPQAVAAPDLICHRRGFPGRLSWDSED
jgi:hypothetical protein